MVIAEVTDVQQVTTRSKGKDAEWEAHDAIRKQASEWIKKANEHNMAEITNQNTQFKEAVTQPEDTPTWQALQDFHIVLPLARLLQLYHKSWRIYSQPSPNQSQRRHWHFSPTRKKDRPWWTQAAQQSLYL